MFLETKQKCIPGWPPGMCSWETSRNMLLDRFWKPTLVLSLNVRYLYIGINANVNLLSILWSTKTFWIFLEGGAVWNVCYFTPPPLQQKHSVKICFSPFHEAFDSFSYFKNRAPRNNPGMHSWMTSRNALLEDLQEHAPGEVLGTYSGTLLKC